MFTRLLTGRLAHAQNRALISVVAAMGLLAFSDNLVLTVMPPASLGQYFLARSVLCLLLAAGVIFLTGQRWRPQRLWAVLLRSLFFAAAMGLYFGSLPFLPVAEAAAGLFTAPVFVLILTSLYQRQLPGWRRLLAVFAGSAGVVLLLEPDAPDFTWLHLMPVLGGAFYALANISARHLCADEPPLALVIGYFILIGIGGFLFSANLPDPALSWPASVWPALSGWQWLSLWVQALLTLLSVWLLVRSYQSGETSRLAISEYSFLGFAALFGWLIWGAIVSPSGWAGMVLVTLAGSLIIARSPSPPRPA